MPGGYGPMRLIIIGLAAVVGTIVLGSPGGERWRQEAIAYYVAGLKLITTVPADPAKKAHDDCVERWRQGFRTTKAGC
jgi:hypothetical protein